MALVYIYRCANDRLWLPGGILQGEGELMTIKNIVFTMLVVFYIVWVIDSLAGVLCEYR